MLQLALSSAPGLAVLFLNESGAAFVVWATAAPDWSCETPPECLGAAGVPSVLGAAEVVALVTVTCEGSLCPT